MKNIYLLILFFCFNVFGQVINFSDLNLKNRLLSSNTSNGIAIDASNNAFKLDVNSNGEIEVSEALLVYKLNLNSYSWPVSSSISDLEGLQNFQNLRVLKCSKNSISLLNLTPFVFLEEIEANQNLISSINISNLSNLKKLFAYSNSINSIVNSNNDMLENIWLSNNLLTSLDLSVFPSLKWISCDNNQLTSINLLGLSLIDQVECGNNALTSLNLEGLTSLRILGCESNQISSLNLSSLTTLNILRCGFNPIENLNINGLTNLGMLNVDNTLLTSIDASQSGLIQLFASGCSNLQSINVRNGVYSYSDPDLLYYAFLISNNPNLLSICTDDNEQNELQYTDYNTSGTVMVYNGINCDIAVEVNMGVNDINISKINIFPNPTESILNIQPEIEISNIVIINMLGQKLLSNINQSSIDVSSLTRGTYFITIETYNGKQTQKFIKN